MVQAHFIQMGIELCSVCRDACLGIMIMYPKKPTKCQLFTWELASPLVRGSALFLLYSPADVHDVRILALCACLASYAEGTSH